MGTLRRLFRLFSNKKVVLIATAVGGIGVSIALAKEYLTGGPKYEIKDDLTDVVAIVTGATSGIGLATAERLAHKKARVIMASRDMDKCKEVRRKIVLNARNRNVVCRQCDLSSMDSVKAFAARMLKDEKKINLLLNNAAVKQSKLRKITEDGFEAHFGANYLGHFLLTMLLLEKLNESGPSRIVNVVDVSYKTAHLNFDDLNASEKYDRVAAYNQSKLANLAFSDELAERCKGGTKITVNAVYPGMVKTGLDRRERYARSWVFKPIRYLVLRTDKQGSRMVTHAATAPELVDVTGQLFSDCEIVPQEGEVTDPKIRARLWLTSEKWTRLDEAKKEVAERVAKAIEEDETKKATANH